MTEQEKITLITTHRNEIIRKDKLYYRIWITSYIIATIIFILFIATQELYLIFASLFFCAFGMILRSTGPYLAKLTTDWKFEDNTRIVFSQDGTKIISMQKGIKDDFKAQEDTEWEAHKNMKRK